VARKTLTEKSVASTTPPKSGRLEVFDTVVPGLCCRITEHGGRSFSLMYRFAGKLRRDTLGAYPRLRLTAAREKARRALEQVGQGKDPRAELAEQAAAQKRREANTVGAIAEQFVELYASERRRTDLERILDPEVVTSWGDRPISNITRADALDALATVKRRPPVRANRVLAAMKLFFGWAVEHDYLQGSPVAAIRKPTRETKRDRILSEDEIRAFWRACDRLGWPHGPLYQLLLLTAPRRDELGKLRWSEVNADKALVEIPAGRFKGNRAHVIPLSRAATEIIDTLPKIATPTGKLEFVFTRSGRAAIADYSQQKVKLDALMLEELRKAVGSPEAELPGWTLHDLRRSARTEMSRIGVNPDIAERVLGHAIPGVRGIYDRFEYHAEKEAALTRWAAHLQTILNPA
jgi:integrase